MIELERVHHVTIATKNLEEARFFYSEILKFKEIERPPFKSKGVWYDLGEQQLHVVENPKSETLRLNGLNSLEGHFSIWVKSYTKTLHWLNKAGIKYEIEPISVAGFSQIYILDRDNNVIEFAAPYNS
ncbi:VOC family protein [Paenibacillus tyrfis]|uniref:VOC family protein n=1 Tax=Paenibacillus tyrfis TaxID=1501230 RepID=UPI0020A196A2|nr:VOC family protein [Paenibacillus tyrfis]MCP1308085.1 VOC family protein [Paenibacillus tyrfis]